MCWCLDGGDNHDSLSGLQGNDIVLGGLFGWVAGNEVKEMEMKMCIPNMTVLGCVKTASRGSPASMIRNFSLDFSSKKMEVGNECQTRKKGLG